MAIKQQKQNKQNAYADAAAFDSGKHDTEQRKSSKRPIAKVIALNVVNVLLIVGTMYFLNQLPKIAGDIKKTRSEHLAAQETSDAAILTADIQKNIDKISSLEKVFMDQNGFADFLRQASALHDNGNGVLLEFSFPGGKSVLNNNKELGVPVLLVFQGSLDQVNNALQRIFSMPFIIEPVSMEVEGNRESLILRYGGFILVDKSFGGTQ